MADTRLGSHSSWCSPLGTQTLKHKSEALVPWLGSEIEFRFKVVGFVPRKEQPGPGFQLGFAACLHGASSPPVGGQADSDPVHQEGIPAPIPLLPQLLLMERKLQEVHPLLTLCGQIVENWQGNPIQKESLRVFFLVLQVTHYLDAGQVCSASHRRAAGEWAGSGGAQAKTPALLSPPFPCHKVYLVQGLGPPHTLSCSAMSAVPLQAEVTQKMVCLHGGISHGLTHSLVHEQLKVSKGSLGDP